MSAYTTPKKLVDAIGAPELARQLQLRFDVPALSPELLTAVIDNADLSDFSDDEQQTGQLMRVKIESLITEAGLVIDGYLWDVVGLPLAQDIIDKTPLPGCAKDLFIFNLFLRPEEAEMKRYAEAIKLLTAYRDGKSKLPLPAEPAPEPVRSSGIKTAKPKSQYNWGAY